ncbi:MAG: hypothetical protein ACOX3S_04245 [Anaerolineae bacterium]|jgi:hypothetical protein
MTTHNGTPSDRRPPEEPSGAAPSPAPRASADEALDLLLDALLERQRLRREHGGASAARPATPGPAYAREPAPRSQPAPARAPAAPQPGQAGWQPPAPVPSIGLGGTAWRMLLIALALVALFNIPVTAHGVSLARILPDAEALVIRDGLLLKGPGDEVYVLEDDKLRWISSLEAFERLGYDWDHVHIVDEAFLARFEQGAPVHVLLKCDGEDPIYRIEKGQKRWIKDIPTFEAEGHVWADVHLVDCDYLAALPSGPPIPVDAGAPPD